MNTLISCVRQCVRQTDAPYFARFHKFHSTKSSTIHFTTTMIIVNFRFSWKQRICCYY